MSFRCVRHAKGMYFRKTDSYCFKVYVYSCFGSKISFFIVVSFLISCSFEVNYIKLIGGGRKQSLVGVPLLGRGRGTNKR